MDKLQKYTCQKAKAFTLIELLIVLSIIGVIISFVLVSAGNTRSRSRDAKRASDLAALNTAILMYFRETGHYPSLPDGCGAQGVNGVSTNQVDGIVQTTSPCYAAEFIKGVASAFIQKLPTDPGPSDIRRISGSFLGNQRGFLYYHYLCKDDPLNCPTATEETPLECYKILANDPERPATLQYKSIWDPARDGGGSDALSLATREGATPTAWSYYSNGCAGK